MPCYSERAKSLVAIGSMLLVTGIIWWMVLGPPAWTRVAVQTHELKAEWALEDELASLADASPASVSAQNSLVAQAVFGTQVPDEPLDGQVRAPCRRRGTVTINGGCWIPWATLSPPCGDDAYEWRGACYLPLFEHGRGPTSEQPH